MLSQIKDSIKESLGYFIISGSVLYASKKIDSLLSFSVTWKVNKYAIAMVHERTINLRDLFIEKGIYDVSE